MTAAEAPRHAVSRRDAQPQWRDSASGYVRRLGSPPGGDGDTDIVAVDLPAGAALHFEPHTGAHCGQQVLLLQGELQLLFGEQRVALQPADGARMPLDLKHGFTNPGSIPAHYLVVVRSTAARQHGAAR